MANVVVIDDGGGNGGHGYDLSNLHYCLKSEKSLQCFTIEGSFGFVLLIFVIKSHHQINQMLFGVIKRIGSASSTCDITRGDRRNE